jgi:hypothetical protein
VERVFGLALPRRVGYGSRPISRATVSAASSCIAGTTCEYRSRGNATELCPRRSCTTLGLTPAASASAQCPWRKS